jgi:hypothetical protein
MLTQISPARFGNGWGVIGLSGGWHERHLR